MSTKTKNNENIFDYLDRKADEWEPYAAGVSLGGAAIGAGLGTTVVGAPLAAPVAAISQVPSLAIDGYQAARDWYKGNTGSALWNTLETALDVAGAKIVSKGANLLSTAKTAKVAPKTFQSTKVGHGTGATYKARAARAAAAEEYNRKLIVEFNVNSIKLAKKWALEKYGTHLYKLPQNTQDMLMDAARREIKYGPTKEANFQRFLEKEESAKKQQKILTPFVWVPNFVDIGAPLVK